jgi:hypothetical protein
MSAGNWMDVMERSVAVTRNLRILGANLAVAGALCAAFEMGGAWLFWLDDPYQSANCPPWTPGCGRSVTR